MDERTSIPNGIAVDEKTGDLRVGRGATGWVTVSFPSAEEGSIDPDSDIVLFIVTKAARSRDTVFSMVNGRMVSFAGKESDECVLRKIFNVTVSDDGVYEVNIGLTNAETRKLEVGEYLWNGILITDPDIDDDGNIEIDDSDCVVPFYVDGDRPKLIVEEVGCIV